MHEVMGWQSSQGDTASLEATSLLLFLFLLPLLLFIFQFSSSFSPSPVVSSCLFCPYHFHLVFSHFLTFTFSSQVMCISMCAASQHPSSLCALFLIHSLGMGIPRFPTHTHCLPRCRAHSAADATQCPLHCQGWGAPGWHLLSPSQKRTHKPSLDGDHWMPKGIGVLGWPCGGTQGLGQGTCWDLGQGDGTRTR